MGFFSRTKTNSASDKEYRVDLVERRFAAIQKISKLIVEFKNLDGVLDEVLKTIPSVVGVALTAVLLFDEKSRGLRLYKTSIPSVVEKIVESATRLKINEIQYPLSDPSNIFTMAINDRSIKTLKNVEESLIPLMDKFFAKRIVNLTRLQIKLLVVSPLIVNDKVIGTIALGWKNEELSLQEEQFLNTFTNQMAIALYNANLFEQVNNQVIQLTNKNKELTSLYNLASSVSQTLDPKRVSQAAVDSLPQDEKMLGAVLASLDDREVKLSIRAVSQNQLSYQIEKILGGFDRYGIDDINSEKHRSNAYIKVIRAGTPYFTNDINEAFGTVLPPQLLIQIGNLIGIKSLAIYPIKFRTKTVGVITYLLKDKTKEEIDNNQQQLLATYSTQISVALENANLFTKSQVIQQNLENALKQLETLRNHERDMIDIMGHELRTPMSIVRNALVMLNEVISNDPELNRHEKVKKYSEIGLDSARREVTLIETLLSATKADGKGFQLLLEKVDMLEVIDASINAFGKECEKKGLYLKYEKPNEEMFVYTDRTRIQEVSDNFLSNATKYTMKGGVEIKMYKEDGFVYIDYLDTGMGISDDDVKRLGNKFFRAKQYLDDAPIQSPLGEKLQIVRPGGTGLGLYVTFNLIKILDGRLYIKSKLKVGSKFTFGMPVYSGQPSKQIEKKVEVFEAKPVQNTII